MSKRFPKCDRLQELDIFRRCRSTFFQFINILLTSDVDMPALDWRGHSKKSHKISSKSKSVYLESRAVGLLSLLQVNGDKFTSRHRQAKTSSENNYHLDCEQWLECESFHFIQF